MRRFALVAALAAAAAPAWAGQVAAKDGRFEADVSARQMSRISLIGEKIVAVRKIDDPHGPQLIVETDEASGDAFVAFDGDVDGRAFSAFLTTESGKVVQAVLRPVPGEGQTVIVTLGQSPTSGRSSAGAPVRADGGRSPYQETLVHFVRVMFNGDEVEGVTRRVSNAATVRAGPFSVRQMWAYDTQGLHGRVIYLTNVGKNDEPVRLDAFLVERVYAAAASHEVLRPGEQARIFIVEEPR